MCLIGSVPKRTASLVKAYLDRKMHNETLSVLGCPPLSPDLIIIESLWDQHDRECVKRQPAPKDKLLICFKKPRELLL